MSDSVQVQPEGPFEATPTAELERQIMDANTPKMEREWWAASEITALRAENERLRAALHEIAKVTRGWEPGVWSEEEGRKYFASQFFSAQYKARAALATQPAGDKT